MPISNKKRKAVLRSYPGKSIKELAGELKISEREVKAVLIEAGKLTPRSFKTPLIVAGSILAAAIVCAGVYSFITRPGPGKLAGIRDKLNVLIVTIDTCRADHIGCYGYEQAQTPVIDALAENGVRFASAYAHQPITLPSHSTIFTGTHPAFHGVDDNGLFRLPEKAQTLAEVLKDKGFSTAAVISSHVLHHQFGLGQGFDSYDDTLSEDRVMFTSSMDEMKAAVVSDRAVDWIGKQDGRQWLLWLHYFDPHANYVPPERFRKNLSSYDGEIAYVDFELGRVIDALEKKGVRDRTLIIVTSDHGESLGEHEEQTHGCFLYDPAVHVPLIVSLPAAIPGGRVVNRMVSLMDLMPTVLEILGIEQPNAVQGRSLLSLVYSDPEQWADEPVLMETKLPWYEHNWSPSYAIVDENFKYIKSPRPELYDLSADPGEANNIYEKNRGRAEAMARTLEQTRKQYAQSSIAARSEVTMDDQTRDRLASLGYVFSGSGSKKPTEKAPDVKDVIQNRKLINQATALKNQGKLEEAISILEGGLKRHPDDPRILKRIGYWHTKLGRYEEAERYLVKALQLNPTFVEALLIMGIVYNDTGRFDQAKVITDTLLELNPDSEKAHNLEGLRFAKMKNYEAAIPHFNKSIELFPNFQDAHTNLGLAYYYQGKYEKAYQEFEKSNRIIPGDSKAKKLMKMALKKLADK